VKKLVLCRISFPTNKSKFCPTFAQPFPYLMIFFLNLCSRNWNTELLPSLLCPFITGVSCSSCVVVSSFQWPMVFFVCDGCNETLKKNQVDKHAGRCYKCYSVTCVDCNQTFPGNDYASHVTCVTEAEKYQKSLYQQKKATKLNPQELWAMTIQEAVVNVQKAPSNIQHFIPKIAECGNVPRNKNKFMNFAKNSLKLNSLPILESIWNFLESFKSTPEAAAGAEASSGEASSKTETTPILPTEEREEQQKSSLQDSESVAAPEKKKKKKKTSDPEAELVSVVAPVEQSQEEAEPLKDAKEKKKKKKKVEEAVVEVEEVSSLEKKKKRKERSAEEEETNTEVKEKKSKKKKSKVE
jgi:cell growth-regulating nucleolar protein